MAVEVRARTRRHHLPRRVRYELRGQPVAPVLPALPPVVVERAPWRVENLLYEMREWVALRRQLAWANAEARQWQRLAGRYEQELTVARRTLAILAQQALEREWVTEEGSS